ncbi:MAG: NAD(+) synthase [Erysipelotrichales bacterium]|nr:NAD(+) synthase [Erysipelotrichales bacterium]
MFDAKKEKDGIVKFIRDYFEKNHCKGAVLGVSGGKDSAVVSALLCEALGKENVVGLTLPCHSHERDAAGAKLVADHFGFELINIDLTETYDSFIKQIEGIGNFTEEERKNSDINLKPRLCMASCYYMAALLSATRGGTYLVPTNGNKCERFVGYYTKGGDNIGDFSPIGELTVEEVIKVGEVLGVPEKVLYRTPDDGLSGMTDEQKMGVTYRDIAKVIKGEEVDPEVYEKIMRMHRNSAHKTVLPMYIPGENSCE